MRRLILLVAILFAVPCFAQTGDCTAETGTSTTWTIVEAQPDRVKIRYEFYAAGVSGQTEITRTSSIAVGTDLVAFANSQCQSVDDVRILSERRAAKQAVFRNPLAQMVQPAYPEPCLNTYPEPENVSAGLDAVGLCRLAEFHQFLILEVWPEEALMVFDFLHEIFDWLNSNQVQGGAAFNTGQKQDWIGVTASQWTTQVNPRMNNMNAIASGLQQDAQNLQWREPPLD